MTYTVGGCWVKKYYELILLYSLAVFPIFALAADADKAAFLRPDTVPFPESNPYSVEKAALGKMLFFDPRLSKNKNMTCATCHNPSFGWEDATNLSTGAQNTQLPRHSPTIINMAWGDKFFWDGRANSLEEQALGPIESDIEMNLPIEEAISRLSQIPYYQEWFGKVFGDQGITKHTITQAIATFERTIVSGEAPFDRWVNGDEDALSESAQRGFALFTGKAGCANCHSGWNFTDNQFHDIGLPGSDLGLGERTQNPQDSFSFKTPSLRNIAQRAPYMHDGRFNTLQEAIVSYITGASNPRPSLSQKMMPIALSASDVSDLEAFMMSLTGEDKEITLPLLPF